MLWVTGDLHGGNSAYHISSARFKPTQKRGDICFCCGDLGGVWFHDYHTNMSNKRNEDYFLEQKLRQRVLWLAVDGNHENFARLFGGEFSVVELFGGKAYKIRDHVYYLKRGEVFEIEGKRFLAFGGANSHDRFGAKVRSFAWGRDHDYIPPRKEGIDWWAEEIPSKEDFDNACRNLDRVGWQVDQVITHTCPKSQRKHFLQSSRVSDPVEDMLEEIYQRLDFKEWHFGHFHIEKKEGKFHCHWEKVKGIQEQVNINAKNSG